MLESFGLILIFRWLHILAAITAVGGSIFIRFALLPAAGELPDAERQKLMASLRRRWSKFVAAAIFFLVVSGLFNYVSNHRRFELQPPYEMLFGIKFLLALGVFFIASLMSGRSEAAQRFQQKARMWLSINVALAVAVVCISGYMKNLPHMPRPAAESAHSVQASPADLAFCQCIKHG